MPSLNPEMRSEFASSRTAGDHRLPPKLVLVLSAFLQLVKFDWFVTRGDFDSLYAKVRDCPKSNTHTSYAPETIAYICSVVDYASIWYWKRILCLQRAAATACFLKRYGIPAQMVIGAQVTPFKAHAWVEVKGSVVNDKSVVSEWYAVLDRC